MLKAADPAMTIGPVRLLRKSGGRHGPWQRSGLPADQEQRRECPDG
jgi:hypothetical protein